MKKAIFKSFVELSGHPVSAAVLKTIASSRLSKKLIKPFARTYHIDEKEAEYPIEHYDSLQAYFTRKLKKGSRPIDMRSQILISPVDGVVTEMGIINTDQTFMIKNHLYSIKKILGDEKRTIPFKGGFFYVFYLSPSHYHHFHYPYDGEVIVPICPRDYILSSE